MCNRFFRNDVNLNSKPTIGVDFAQKTINIQNKRVKMQVWDTAGLEKYRSHVFSRFYDNQHGAILVFDISSSETFENLGKYLEEMHRYAHLNIVKILVGNKSDLEAQRTVSKKEAEDFAKEHGMEYIETSAIDSSDIGKVFVSIAEGETIVSTCVIDK